MYAFACFVTAFFEVEHFHAMPWLQRAEMMRKEYDVIVSDRTLRNWCHKLMLEDVIVKHSRSAPWKTEAGGKRFRVTDQEEMEILKQYFADRAAFVSEETNALIDAGKDLQSANAIAWKQAYKRLWEKYNCCYYYCKEFDFSAFTGRVGKEDLKTVYLLSKQISTKKALHRLQQKLNATADLKYITTKEEFDATW